jgi:hypothetical protein
MCCDLVNLVCVFERVFVLNACVCALLVLCGGCSGQATIEPHTNTERRAHTTLVGFVCLLNILFFLESIGAAKRLPIASPRTRGGDNPPSTMYEQSPRRGS